MSEAEKNQERLQAVFRDIFDDESIVIHRAMTAKDIEEWDSLTHINLVVATEKEFGLRFSLAEIKALKNVGEFQDLIERKLAQKPA
jgi:acyl carrier protein